MHQQFGFLGSDSKRLPTFPSLLSQRPITSPVETTSQAWTGAVPTSAESSAARPGKRKRVSLACSACKAKKIKCDRVYPCEACVKRGEASTCQPDQPIDSKGVSHARSNHREEHLCVANTPTPSDSPPHQPSGTTNGVAPTGHEVAILRRRLATLEQALLTRMPDLAPILQRAESTPDSSSPSQHSYSKPQAPLGKNGYLVAPDEESEDAAQVLEELALGHARPTWPDQTSGATPSSGSGPGNSSNPQHSLYPSIILPHHYSDLNRQVLSLVLARLPSNRDITAAVDLYLTELSWVWPLVCIPQLRVEVDEFCKLRHQQRAHEVDPAWLSILFIILAMAGHTIHDGPAPHPQPDDSAYRESIDEFFDASRLCLDFANWYTTPSIRCLTSILLFVTWRTMSPPARGSGPLIKVHAYTMPWVATSVRMAQNLGLDTLWESPESMPIPDPALPEGTSLLARQIGARLWSSVLFLEAMRCAKDGTFKSMIPSDTPTPPVGNYNDTDLGFNLYTPERPPTEVTTGSIERLKCKIGMVALKSLRLKDAPGDQYAKLLELDEELLECLNHRFDPKDQIQESRLRCLESGVHNRMLRLHRPFMVKGANNPYHRRSYVAAVQSSLTIAKNLDMLVNRTNLMNRFWWLSIHVLGAALALATALLCELRKPETDPDVVTYREHLTKIGDHMEELQAKARSASLRSISLYVTKMVRALDKMERQKRACEKHGDFSVAATLADLAVSLQSSEAEEMRQTVEAVEVNLQPALDPQVATQDWLAELEWLAPLADVSISTDLDPHGNLFSSEQMDYSTLMGNFAAIGMPPKM